MSSIAERREAFKNLHKSGCFVIPNPWDIGSARYLERAGFKALATTSAGYAFTQGIPDSPLLLKRDLVLKHIEEIVNATDLPVTADYQEGYGSTPEGVGESVRMCVETGVAGLSIEDATGDEARPLFELEEAIERIRAAREAIDAAGGQVMLTARAECFLVRYPDPLNESIRRLKAYSEAGADLLFAPGPARREILTDLVKAVAPKPLNAIVSGVTDLRIKDFEAIGVRRISLGSSLARAAWGGFIRATRGIIDKGNFAGFDLMTPYAELNEMFAE